MSRDIWFEVEIKELLSDVAELKNTQEVEDLFEVIITPREINDMARRLKISKLLAEGNSYSEISMKLNVSPNIISRVSSGIGYGFRRTNITHPVKASPKKKQRGKSIKYKGRDTFIRFS